MLTKNQMIKLMRFCWTQHYPEGAKAKSAAKTKDIGFGSTILAQTSNKLEQKKNTVLDFIDLLLIVRDGPKITKQAHQKQSQPKCEHKLHAMAHQKTQN